MPVSNNLSQADRSSKNRYCVQRRSDYSQSRSFRPYLFLLHWIASLLAHFLITRNLGFKPRKIHKLKVGIVPVSLPCQLLSPSLSESESDTRRFYDRWIGGSGLLSILGRLIFRLEWGRLFGHLRSGCPT